MRKLLGISLILFLAFPTFAKSKKDKKKKVPTVYTANLLDMEDDTKSSGVTITYSYEVKNNLIFIFGVNNICSARLFEKKLTPDLEEDHYAELNVDKSDPNYHLVPYPQPDDAVLYFEANDNSCVMNMIIRPTQIGSVKKMFSEEKHKAMTELKAQMAEKNDIRPDYLVSASEYRAIEYKSLAVAFLTLATAVDIERDKAEEALEESKKKKK